MNSQFVVVGMNSGLHDRSIPPAGLHGPPPEADPYRRVARPAGKLKLYEKPPAFQSAGAGILDDAALPGDSVPGRDGAVVC